MASLSTIPQDVHYQLLNSLPDFKDLSAAVLSARPLHNAFQTNRKRVLSAVGRNFLGTVFTDALLLARCQEKHDGSAALKVKGLSSSTVRLLVNNAETVGELQAIMFGLLKDQSPVDPQKKDTMTRFANAPPVVAASETESIRFKSAAYRFCVYCLLQTSEARNAFLRRYPKIQVLELSHFVNALWVLVSVIRGRPLETDRDWDFISNTLSTGPHNILQLWKMRQNLLAGDYLASLDFKAALKAAGTRNDDGSDDDDTDFMTQWCDLIDALNFPAHTRSHDAILDGEHKHLAEVFAASGVDSKFEPAPKPDAHRHVTYGDDSDDDLGDESDGILGVVKEDCLDDPFG
ncbi:hypothetical protein B0H19DRAFT_1155050 [Mycena capillaripes]|nr:hypothetical protein B0H19DRAFT_1155050 [Mycena capillaripes]